MWPFKKRNEKAPRQPISIRFKDEDVLWAVWVWDEDSLEDDGSYEIVKLYPMGAPIRGGKCTAVVFTESRKAELHAKSAHWFGTARWRVASCTFGEYRRWLSAVDCHQVSVNDDIRPVSEFVDAHPA